MRCKKQESKDHELNKYSIGLKYKEASLTFTEMAFFAVIILMTAFVFLKITTPIFLGSVYILRLA
jgi:hypothetical protein